MQIFLILLSSICVPICTRVQDHLLGHGGCRTIYWDMGSLSGAASLKKTDLPPPSHQWSIVLQLRVGLLELLHHKCQDFGWLYLVCALCMQLQTCDHCQFWKILFHC